jgi:hypothetical protein
MRFNIDIEHSSFMLRSKRRGFQRYIIGQLKECATRFFKEDIFVRIQDDISSNECNKKINEHQTNMFDNGLQYV